MVRPGTEILDKPLNKGQAAPFSGILLPVYHYKQCSDSLQELPLCENALKDSIDAQSSFGDDAEKILIGAVIGALTTLALQHH